MALPVPPPVDLSSHAGPWTEEDYLALPESPGVELVDGSLLVSPHAGFPHQRLSFNLHLALALAAPEQMEIGENVNVRLRRGRILIPDLAVVSGPGTRDAIIGAERIVLACEITSPSNAATDHVLKLNLYATANIPYYLIIDFNPDHPSALAYRLTPGGSYEVFARAEPGEDLTLDEPFPVRLDLPALATATRPASIGNGSVPVRGLRGGEDAEQ